MHSLLGGLFFCLAMSLSEKGNAKIPECEVQTESICYWTVVRSVRMVDFDEAVSICTTGDGNSKVADIDNIGLEKRIMDVLRTKIDTSRGLHWVHAWIGTIIFPIAKKYWYPGYPIDANDTTNIKLVVYKQSAIKLQGMANKPPTERIDGVVCQKPNLCPTEPNEKEQIVAPHCSRNIGICDAPDCSSCRAHDMCYGPTYVDDTATCSVGSMLFARVDKCDCISCAPFQVYVHATILEECSYPSDSCDFSIRIDGKEITRSTEEGVFNFVLDYPENDRIVLSIVDDIRNEFFAQMTIIETKRDKQAYEAKLFTYRKKRNIKFESSDGMEVTLGKYDSFRVEIPNNSIFQSSGFIYDETVVASVYFNDPFSWASETNIPGTILAAENPSIILNSYGMFQVDLTTEDFFPLTGKITTLLNSMQYTEEERNDMELWNLDKKTGLWNRRFDTTIETRDETELPPESRTKYIAAEFSVSDSTEIWTYARKMPEPYCYLKMRFFATSHDLTESAQVQGVRASTGYRLGARSYPTNYIQTVSTSNGMCIPIPCDLTGLNPPFQIWIEAQSGFEAYGPAMPDDILKHLFKWGYGPIQGFAIDESGSISGSYGPVYRSTFACEEAPFLHYHYRFVRSVRVAEENNLIPIDENDLFSPWIDNVFSWWPNRDVFKACYLPISVPLDSLVKITVTSFGGTHSLTRNHEYGDRSGYSDAGIRCIEYKCPEYLSDGEYDRPNIKVTATKDGVPLIVASLSPSKIYRLDSEVEYAMKSLGKEAFIGPAPVYRAGFVISESFHPLLAKADAERNCPTDDSAITFGKNWRNFFCPV